MRPLATRVEEERVLKVRRLFDGKGSVSMWQFADGEGVDDKRGWSIVEGFSGGGRRRGDSGEEGPKDHF